MTTMIKRYDQFSYEVSRKTPEGYLVCRARCAKAGVLTYTSVDGGERRELVLPEELSNTDALMSIARKPVTDGHPTVKVDATNARLYSRGVVLDDVRFDGGYVEVEMIIQDKELIDKIEAGQQRQISAGYTLSALDDAPGEHPVYGRYDAVQRGRYCNHVAIVERGRAGPDVAIRADSEEDISVYREDHYTATAEEMTMAKKQAQFGDTIAALEKEVTALSMRLDELGGDEDEAKDDEDESDADALKEVAAALESVLALLETIKSEAAAKQDEHDNIKGQLDALMAEFNKPAGAKKDEDEKEKEDKSRADEDDRLRWYNERKECDQVAARYNLDAASVKDVSNAAYRRMIVEAHVGEERKDATDAEIKGAFDLIKSLKDKRDASYTNASDVIRKQREDRAIPDSDKAAAAYRDAQLNAWQNRK